MWSGTFLRSIAVTQSGALPRVFRSIRVSHGVQQYQFRVKSHTTMAATQPKARTALEESESGAFKRKASVYRNFVQKGGEYTPEGGHSSTIAPPLPPACRASAVSVYHSLHVAACHAN